MSALNAKSRLTAMSTQYSNPMAARPSKKQVYGKKGGRRRLDPLKKRRPRSPSPELCSAHRLPNPVQYIFAPEEITEEEIEARKTKLMVDILVKGGSGWQDPLVAQFGSQEMEAPPAEPVAGTVFGAPAAEPRAVHLRA